MSIFFSRNCAGPKRMQWYIQSAEKTKPNQTKTKTVDHNSSGLKEIKSFTHKETLKDRVATRLALGFPGSSAGKESVCNAGDSSLIPGLGRSPGEGIDYPLQYSWASQVAQLVKNLPAMRETWVWPLGWEDPLEKVSMRLVDFLAFFFFKTF